jgi:hypothetical protein
MTIDNDDLKSIAVFVMAMTADAVDDDDGYKPMHDAAEALYNAVTTPTFEFKWLLEHDSALRTHEWSYDIIECETQVSAIAFLDCLASRQRNSDMVTYNHPYSIEVPKELREFLDLLPSKDWSLYEI